MVKKRKTKPTFIDQFKQAYETVKPLIDQAIEFEKLKQQQRPQQEVWHDPYVLLGLHRGCTEEQFKKSYKAKARAYHPDLGNTSDAMLKMINQAADIIKEEHGWK